MPDKPTWYGAIPQALQALEALDTPWVDRSLIQSLLGVGRRRAQQLMQPIADHVIGRNLLVSREQLRRFLLDAAAGKPASQDRQRRRRLARQLNEWARTPRLPVEAPARIAQQQLASLPSGIELTPGRISVHFATSREALEKLLALAMAISNDLDGFEAATGCTDVAVQLYSQTDG